MSSKQERAVEIILEAAARGKKAILFTEWVASSSWYASLPELAHLSPVRVTGSVTLRRKKGQDESERERRFREFRLGGSGLLVATARCAAEGLNLPEAEVVLFDSYPFTPSQQQQAWSRVLRPAQTADPVEISLLGVAGTIDDFLLALTSLKRLAIGEGIDYEEVAIDLEDVPDPLMYANHLVAASSAIDKTYAAIEWQERLKTQHAALHRR
jgi:superfamily II DNA or RNA helicase